jgi:hypothetical protein
VELSVTDLDEFERARWEREGWERQRSRYVDRLKGQAAGSTTRRIETFEWVRGIVEQVDRAYTALDVERGYTVGGTTLAKQLDKQGVLTRNNVRPTQHRDGGKAWANALIGETDAAMIDEAVMECRTLMTALCLSANFATVTPVDNLENHYIEIIADIIELGRRLRNMSPISRPDLLVQARNDAMETARRQRQDKPPVTMAARERYWRDRPAPIRKIFAS